MGGLLSAWRDWRERRQVLRDIRQQQANTSERDRFKVRDNLTYALSALERDDPVQATELWTKSLSLYPRETRASRLALDVLIRLRRFDEAEALMRQGQKDHPRDIYFASGLGKIAQARGDHDSAIEHWAALRKQFPGASQGYAFGAEALMAKNRLVEAEALAEQAIKMFPDDMMGYLEHARVAVQRQDWEEASRRWLPVRDQFGSLAGDVGVAQAMVRLGRYDEADTLLSEASVRFPTEPAPWAERARSAQIRGDATETVARWKHLIRRFPLHIHGYFEAGASLGTMGEVAEAEAILRASIVRFPDEQRCSAELANLLRQHPDHMPNPDLPPDPPPL